jgi:hypothetical protein
MEKKMRFWSLADSEDMESESQSESSTFDEVLDSPIVQLPDINHPLDVSAALGLEHETVLENADAGFTAPAQAPKNKKKKEKEKEKERLELRTTSYK